MDTSTLRVTLQQTWTVSADGYRLEKEHETMSGYGCLACGVTYPGFADAARHCQEMHPDPSDPPAGFSESVDSREGVSMELEG